MFAANAASQILEILLDQQKYDRFNALPIGSFVYMIAGDLQTFKHRYYYTYQLSRALIFRDPS